MILDIVEGLAGLFLLLCSVGVGLLLWLAFILLTGQPNTPKTRAVEQRLNTLFTNVGAANSALSGQATTTAQPAGVPTGGVNGGGSGSFEVGPSDNGGITSGQIGSGTSHYHAMSHQHVYDHTHDFDGHTHNLPTIP